MATTAPYGSWESPITADSIVSKTINLGTPFLAGKEIYWNELRPSEGGRVVIVHWQQEGSIDLNPAPFNARTRVHEYGGRAVAVHDNMLIFANFADQRLYTLRQGEEASPLTPDGVDLRYADFVVDATRNRLITVREDHRQEGEAINTLAAVSLTADAAGNEGEILVAGNDFYSTPRLSPDGRFLSWLTWNHPNMPWDGTELWLAPVQADGSLGNATLVAGGPAESIFQPSWSPDGVLYFVSDRTGWWNLYRFRHGKVEAVIQMEAEFGEPQWVFGSSTYAFATATQIVCTYRQNGCSTLALIDTESLALTPIDSPYTDMTGICAAENFAVLRVGSPTQLPVIVRLDLQTREFQVLRQTGDIDIDPAYFSRPQAIEFPTEDGLTAHAFYYPPHNPDFVAPAGELPLLIVESHGGPTGETNTTLDLSVQYWTSRGFAILDVNYGGSTGYGRAYRQRLNSRWGVVDIDDCCNGARHLVEQGLVDGNRMIIRGGSAGGYTTLGALTFRDVFSAGASYYGVSDLAGLATETHKFESRYLDGLIGPYPAEKALYEARSPIHHAEQLSCPVIFFQGLEDKVVLPNQAERMVEALLYKEVPVAYVPFEGEQHGFRRAENIKRAIEGELYFYAQIFHFTPADQIEPVEIENL